ncbi:MAG TPA: hypothetical protein VMT87_13520, partial [Vicinamibacteria bacterium]|nr:hypothetical protein [Vicinamibacteria bacterium]
EREDAKTLGTALVLVPLVWLLLGWTWSETVSGHDGLANVLVVLRELAQAGGDWSSLLYRPELLGGMKVRDAVGPLPIAAALARLGLSPSAILNLTTFLVQVLIAFLGVRAATDLATAWRGSAPRLGFALRAAGVCACAFAPVLGWRLGYGHLTLVTGTLPYLAAVALVAAAGVGSIGMVLLAVAAFAIVNGVLFTGHQMVLYGAVFGGPILVGLWASAGRPRRDLALPAAVVAGSLLIALPEFWGVLRHALGTDSLRTMSGMDLAYSYLTAHPLDWLGSLAWTRQAVAPWRPADHHHEVNNPAGPLLVLAAALVPWRKARALAVGVLLSVLMALAFSLDAKPLSDLLLLFPPLGSFRVPTRAIMPALYLLPVLALAGVLARDERPPHVAWALAAGALLVVLPSLAREVLGWTLAAACLVPAVGMPRAVALVALAVGGLGAFRERLPPFVAGDALLFRAGRIGEVARGHEPALGSPLNRVRPAFERPEFLANTSLAAGLSSLDGYYFPQRRFVELVSVLRYQPYLPNSLLLRFPPDHPSSVLLYQLYNVAWTVDEHGNVGRQGPTAGPAWFSAGVARTWRYQDLREELRRPADGLHNEARRTLWLMADDLHVWRAHLPEALVPECAGARVLGVEALRGGGGARAEVGAPADCPLTFAMNYAENLRATALAADGRTVPAQVFPAYGALAAVWVPRGATEVRVRAVPTRLPFAPVWRGLGFALLLAAAVAARATPRRPALTAAV